jgi:hypothetical protein
MPKIVIAHKVANVENWLSFNSERAAAIGDLGGTNAVDHVDADGSDVIAITCEMADVDAALAAVKSPPPEPWAR